MEIFSVFWILVDSFITRKSSVEESQDIQESQIFIYIL